MLRKNFKALRLAAAAVGLALAATGCGVTGGAGGGGGTTTAADQPLTGLRIMVPNTAGGGYDTTARVAAQVMEETKVA